MRGEGWVGDWPTLEAKWYIWMGGYIGGLLPRIESTKCTR